MYVSLGNDWNGRQIRKALIEEYPYLQPRKLFNDKIPENYDYEYIRGEHELPEGWMELFLQCCEDIKEPLIKADYLYKFRFSQIKEKYGSMRLYNFGAPVEVHDILRKYEFLSQQVCCVCGKPAVVMTSDWVCPYCMEHAADSGEDINTAAPIELKTSYTSVIYGPDHCEKVIDCNSEWERYLERVGYIYE